MTQIVDAKAPNIPVCPRVLIVDDEPAVRELIAEVFERELKCRLHVAGSVAEAKQILSTQPIELLVADIMLPDGDGISLLKMLRTHQPQAEAIVITGTPSMEFAVDALRGGAMDFVQKPFSISTLLERVRRVLYRQEQLAKNEKRIDRLKGAVKRLNESRRLVTKKVDLLCNDLVSAYGELSRQLDQVRTEENFRNLLNQSHDLEQMLCHAMDWLLRQIGYANVAIWLVGDDQFQLGAYMKYTIAGDGAMVESMRKGFLPKLARDGFIHLEAEAARAILSSAESKLLPDQTIVATHCTYLGESLAGIVLFREGAKPFTPEDAAILKAVGPVFAVCLAAAVREETPDQDGEAEGAPDPSGELFEEPPEPRAKKRKKRKSDASESDWWKTGGPPPF